MCNRKPNIPSVKNPKLQAESIIFYFLYFSDSPKRLTFVHTLVWVIGLFGIFFIIAGHGHYTIDCLVAFYIASRIFTYHHAFANNRSLMTRDQKRLKKIAYLHVSQIYIYLYHDVVKLFGFPIFCGYLAYPMMLIPEMRRAN
jgi:hypothetical protein